VAFILSFSAFKELTNPLELFNAFFDHFNVNVSHHRGVPRLESIVELLGDLLLSGVELVYEVQTHVEVEISALLGPGVHFERADFLGKT